MPEEGEEEDEEEMGIPPFKGGEKNAMPEGDVPILSQDDMASPEGEEEMPEEMPEEGEEEMPEEMPEEESLPNPDQQDQVSDMVHSHMNGEEYKDPNEPDYTEIKENVKHSLEMFKQNKELLEQAKQGAPQLYEAMISMMRSMISMAKMISGESVGEEQMQDVEQTPDEEVEIPENEGQGEVPVKKP
jgi:hypothetical protein